MPLLDFIYFEAGGGHRSAATALRQVISERRPAWQTRLVNLQELLDPLDMCRKLTGRRLQDIYNLLLKRGWTLGAPQLLRVMQFAIRRYHQDQVRMLAAHWSSSPPDLALSLVPHFNRALREGLLEANPAGRFVTLLTDIADYPPHFWIERQDQYLICGSQRAVEQARALGHPEHHIFRTSGMVLHPRFYESPPVDRPAERRRLGLSSEKTTGLVLFGGQGSTAIRRIVERLDRSGLDVQLILICGRNEKLAERMRACRGRLALYVEGFTADVPYYMQLSDFFIGKPGPGSISEALAMGLPVIVESNAWTLPQERYNAEWVVEQQAGLAVSNFRHIAAAVEKLLEPRRFEACRKRAAAVQNRAIFEVPEILAKILDRD
jgi:hypothetical protein